MSVFRYDAHTRSFYPILSRSLNRFGRLLSSTLARKLVSSRASVPIILFVIISSSPSSCIYLFTILLSLSLPSFSLGIAGHEILGWCDDERNDLYLVRCAWGVSRHPCGFADTGVSVWILAHTRVSTVSCVRAAMCHRLNYHRLVPKPVPPLLLWATTVIGLYRAICWLSR